MVAVELLIVLEHHPHAGHDQHDAEDVQDPLEAREQQRADADEQTAHHERAENPVEQHAVLADRRHREVLEDHDHHEEVVDAERFLDHVAREKRQGGIAALEVPEAEREHQRQRHPDNHPDRCFARPHFVRLAVEDAEVQGEHRQHESHEPDPEPDVGGHARGN